MSYTNYSALVARWGVELAGWTEETVVNPGVIQTACALKRLLDALRKGHCYWRVLTKAEWDQKKDDQESAEPKARKRRRDHGTTKAPRSKRVKWNQGAGSKSRSPHTSDDEEEDEEDDEEGDEKQQQHGEEEEE